MFIWMYLWHHYISTAVLLIYWFISALLIINRKARWKIRQRQIKNSSKRYLHPSVKIILSSGYSLNGQAQQIMNRGCHEFIQNPFSMAQISRKIREVLDGQLVYYIDPSERCIRYKMYQQKSAATDSLSSGNKYFSRFIVSFVLYSLIGYQQRWCEILR
jgi:response regulator RpfG family c-di-GMP phosphodiesterase